MNLVSGAAASSQTTSEVASVVRRDADDLPLISIVVAIYNVEGYLNDCVRSIISQSYANLDIVLVDDGSTDSSGDMCDRFALQDPRVRVVHKVNGGLSDARNAGLSVVHGDYVAFVDGDDFVSRYYIDELAKPIFEGGCDLSACDSIEISSADYYDFSNHSRSTYLTYYTEEALVEMLLGRVFSVSACGKLAPTILWSAHPFPTGKVYEDLFLMPDIFASASKVAKIQAPLYGQLMRSGSITRERHISVRQYRDYHDALLRNEKRFSEHASSKVRDACLAREQVECARMARIYRSVEERDDTSKEIYLDVIRRLRSSSCFSNSFDLSIVDWISITLTRYSPFLGRIAFRLFQKTKVLRSSMLRRRTDD
ncbi:glycosyltransferase family 2 protein [Adlercreutzia sp. ZJ141]|uniref:glycosyltransferase family 2 protein n=1 Tax=Adlercreutzia sp. ZJ141 TaxID=2709406 RepID=UPI0013E9B44D|nr:glycosyltransferase family 2 protein [Adlercreutzia sp. ZJ141]